METQTIKPSLGVFASNPDISPAKLLVICGIAIGLEASLNECALFFGQPADSIRVVGDEPVRNHRNDDGE